VKLSTVPRHGNINIHVARDDQLGEGMRFERVEKRVLVNDAGRCWAEDG
jgi:hypothetical protein